MDDAAADSPAPKRIAVFHTGGTIAMRTDDAGAVSTSEDASDYLSEVVPDGIELEVTQLFNIPSPHITVAEMDQLRIAIKAAMDSGNIDGVVVTHGTDTLEETAYFLDLTLPHDIPVVVTGAMRSADEVGADGLPNFVSSVRVAASPTARGAGVLVVLNDEIHAAATVTKTHTTNVATFQSPQSGPLGFVTNAGVTFRQRLLNQENYEINGMHKHVDLVKAYAGRDSRTLLALAGADVSGLVIEALGAGNLPPSMIPGIQALLDLDIPIVITSRCFNGITEAVYGYEGGGVDLVRRGLIMSNGINGPKARLKLAVLLEAGATREEIEAAFHY